MTDAEVEAAAADPDTLPLDAAFWQSARVVFPRQVRKIHTGLRIDEDVLAWFRAQGRGYQTRMNGSCAPTSRRTGERADSAVRGCRQLRRRA
jgi:uncharacterized protein (DUF4415 family)